MAEPFLDLGDISFMIQAGGGGRSTQRVRTDLKAEGQGIAANEFVDAVGGDGVVEFAGTVVAYGAKQGALGVGGVARLVQVALLASCIEVAN